MTAIIVCVLGVIGSSALSVRREGEINSVEMMRLLCDNSSMTIETYLNSVEQSVDMVTRYALDEIDTVELVRGNAVGLQGTGAHLDERTRSESQQTELDAYLADYFEHVERLFRSVANRTNGVVSFYLRINPEISADAAGFHYSNIGRATYKKLLLPDLTSFDPDDVEHVGWYYIPLRQGEATWMEPYENYNLGIKMLSYVAPLYKAGTFIGVVGMDISYDTLVSLISDIRIYETGYAFLLNGESRFVYHPAQESGHEMAVDSVLDDRQISVLRNAAYNDEPLRYTYGGEEKQMFFSTLSNGMKLVVSAPVDEINATWRAMMMRIMIVSITSLILFTVISIYMVRRMTQPLLLLTEASERIAKGDYDVRLNYDGQDEVGKLTATFQHLVDHLNAYISDLNSRAYRDSLTSVHNRGAFAISERKLNDAINAAGSPEEAPRFGIIMLDCNDLKKINDTYGHEKGDVYLRESCSIVCRMFPHSPVFRMGGDEFAVLLQDEPYENRDALLANFDAAVAEHNKTAREAWEQISMAKGTAVYDPKLDADADSVLSRADELMYADKKRIKSARNAPDARA